ncbi:unnamed protein product [marine sediment metagenome]|uniref:Uncharacterized protein n=1 Tax=marine sediment metagenome TaxID=412755 RepID=X1V6C1_9ZZZZ
MAEVKERRPWRIPTGQFIRVFLLAKEEAHPSEIHKALHLEYDKLNQGRRRGERLRPPTFHSFLNYLHQMRLFGLVEPSGREEPIETSEAPWLSEGVVRYYRLTDKGRAEPPHAAWSNWRQLWLTEGYPELD